MSHEDKRSSRRIDRTFVMRVAVDDGNPWPRWSLVTTQDFSAGGVLFTIDQPLKKGQGILCKIHFASRMIDCKAKVIRLSEVFQKPLTQAAASFEWSNESDRLYIEEFAKRYIDKNWWFK